MRTYRVRVEGTGERFDCREDQYVLHAMIRQQAGPIRHGCCGGGCGVCRMRIVSGSVHFEKRMSRAHVSEAEEAEGIVLICCIKPREDLVLARI